MRHYPLSNQDQDITCIPYTDYKQFDLHNDRLKYGTIYVGHPVKSQARRYFPIDEFHITLHKEKFGELGKILRQLNLTYYKLSRIEGYKDEKHMSGELQGKIEGVDAGVEFKYGQDNKSNTRSFIEVRRKPTNEIPQEISKQNLIWYEYEKEWQEAVEDAKDKHFIEKTFKYEYNSDFGVDLNLKLGVEKYKAGIGYKNKKFQHTVWEVYMKRELPDHVQGD